MIRFTPDAAAGNQRQLLPEITMQALGKTIEQKTLDLLGALALIAFVIGGMFFAAFVTMKVWNWFVPATFGIAALAFWQAFGLRLVFWCFQRAGERPKQKKTTQEKVTELASAYLSWSLTLFIAWLAS